MRWGLVPGVVIGVATVACGSRTGVEPLSLDASVDVAVDVGVYFDVGTFDAGGVIDAHEEFPFCGPSNCKGCCQPDGTCVTATNAGACGTEGEACVVCPTGFTICNKPTPGCNVNEPSANCMTTCPGCCWSKGGYCSQGLHSSDCGNGGEACMACGEDSTCEPYNGGGRCTP